MIQITFEIPKLQIKENDKTFNPMNSYPITYKLPSSFTLVVFSMIKKYQITSLKFFQ